MLSINKDTGQTMQRWATLLRSIREQLLTLPDDYKVFPGHGPATTIGRERRSNPYLQAGMEYLFES